MWHDSVLGRGAKLVVLVKVLWYLLWTKIQDSHLTVSMYHLPFRISKAIYLHLCCGEFETKKYINRTKSTNKYRFCAKSPSSAVPT
jgi:hypothetical protein